eukprot:1139110-Pelagomonas_calceolata.AAC.1
MTSLTVPASWAQHSTVEAFHLLIHPRSFSKAHCAVVSVARAVASMAGVVASMAGAVAPVAGAEASVAGVVASVAGIVAVADYVAIVRVVAMVGILWQANKSAMAGIAACLLRMSSRAARLCGGLREQRHPIACKMKEACQAWVIGIERQALASSGVYRTQLPHNQNSHNQNYGY